MHMMRFRRAATVAVLAGLIAAGTVAWVRSSSGSHPARSAAARPPSTEPATSVPSSASALIVRVAFFGGPVRSDGRMALDNTPETGQQVTVTGPGLNRTAVTNRAGEAEFALPSGTYGVKTGCSAARNVTVGVTKRTVQLRCDVP